ncbi:MAG: tRNA (adenosine(37)-N6)-dimethylallyltransferase MiaA [Dehalococcoidia bacterium]|nr:tRNA (adenosine(37)-N6)-dimethylallyltransferase MiaA [Dehalococcoidia bacterium]
MTKPPVVAIVGPTGVGKTALSMALAERFPVEIVSVDSRQVYRGMDIGTAKATAEERASVPHHLIDVVEPTEEFSLAAFLELARAAIAEIQAKGKLPLLVGGTGQYLWALLEAWRVPAVAPDLAYRHEMAELAPEMLRSRLAEVDPKAADAIDPHNVRRLIRALEVHHVTGVAWSAMQLRGPEPYRALVIGLTLPRERLYQRIDQRVERMVKQGWVEEVRRLLASGVTLAHPSMASVGYRDLAACLAGDVALEEAIRNIKTATHRFARHQYAWFRLKDPRIRWLEASEGVGEQAAELVSEFMA